MRLTVAAVLLASTALGHAFVPVKGEVGKRERAISSVAPASFAPLAAAGWQAIWDRATGVPLRLWGGHLDVPGAMTDPATAERAARAFLVAHLALLAPGAAPGDFVVVANQLDGALRTVGFRQTSHGLPVIGGQLGFVFGHDRLFAIGSEAWPNVRVVVPAPHAVTTARAEDWLAAEIGARVATHAIGPRSILAVPRGGAIDYEVVDVLDVRGALGRWDVYVAADGTPIGRASKTLSATGTLSYDAGVRYASGVRAQFAAPDANITVNGNAATTSPTGGFTWSGSAPATVVPGLVGTFVMIVNQAGALATATLTAQPGQSVPWSLASDPLGDAQLSTYIYGNIVRARDRIINPAIASWLDSELVFYVNENATCNAFSTGDEVHLFRGDATCENSGRLADVVFHEFGHSVHYHSIIAGMGAFDTPLSEGLADFNAANLTEDPGIGRGFYYNDVPVRDIDPDGVERVWPTDDDPDPHIAGEIVSGALWDLRKTFVRELGHDPGVALAEQIFTGVMQRAADIPSSYTAALIADDDDGDLGNGTPHFCAIEDAFGRHGLVPGFVTTTIAAPVVHGLAISLAVTTPVTTPCAAPNVTRMTVSWKIGDAVPSSFDLAPGDPAWTGAFPAEPDGTVLQYSVEVALDDGSQIVFPNNPADPMYEQFVGTATPMWCEPFDSDPQWAQTGNLGNEWEWAPAGGAPRSPDPLAAHTGANVLGTDLTGNGLYQANEVTSIDTPMVDVSMYDVVHLQYWRWLTIEDATFDQATVEVNGTKVWNNASDPTGTLDHVDREWRFQDFDVTSLVTDGIASVRWALASDSQRELGGWTLDDVCFVGLAKRPLCGDGVLDLGEQCDDGNTTGGDGCSATCSDEVSASGGGCDATHGGTRVGLYLLSFAVALRIRKRRRTRPASGSSTTRRRPAAPPLGGAVQSKRKRATAELSERMP